MTSRSPSSVAYCAGSRQSSPASGSRGGAGICTSCAGASLANAAAKMVVARKRGRFIYRTTMTKVSLFARAAEYRAKVPSATVSCDALTHAADRATREIRTSSTRPL